MLNSPKLLLLPAVRRAASVAAQLLLASAAWAAAVALRSDFRVAGHETARLLNVLPYLLAVRLVLLHRFRLDRGFWVHTGLADLLRIALATTLGSVAFPLCLFVAGRLDDIPPSLFVLDWLLVIALTTGAGVIARLVHERRHRRFARPGKRTFILGAGEAGEQLLRQLLHDPRQAIDVVGLIDDDPGKLGRALHGIPVLGTSDLLRGLVALHRVRLVLIAIPSATTEELRRLVQRSTEAGVEVKLLPPLQDLVTDGVQVSHMRDVRIDDLLGREPVKLDLHAVEPDIAGKVVVITGAAGSIGSELARQVARFNPLQLVLIDRAESPLYFTHMEIAQSNPAIDVVPVLASVTNADRMQRVFETCRPDCVFHAAAYKHVPLLEWNAPEGVWNNAIGTLRVARCAASVGTRKFVLISTDKAVNPTSILGVTKRIAERIVLELPSLRQSSTDFRVVRFGNVLGSEGSVVPLFKRQLAAGGPITVTHPEVRRYFMTIPEAVQLVLQATALKEGAGRIALLEMGTQVRIVDLAEQLIRLAGLVPHADIDVVFTGLRPGEKMEEELVAPGEKTRRTSVDKIRLVEPNGTSGKALAKRLRDLITVAARHDTQALVRALAALAPSYQPEQRSPVAVAHRNGGPLNGGANGRYGHVHLAALARHANGSRNGNGNGNGNGNSHHAHA